MKMLRGVLLAALAGALASEAAADCDEATGRNCLYLAPPRILTPAEIKQKELEEQRRKEEARREQQRIDDELARRGWPKTREPEIRRFFELQKSAAAAGPKPGAGSALQDEGDDAQTRWLKKNLDAQKPSPTAAERAAYPEAILVCTKPDGAGRFRCLTPVDVISGHPRDKQWSSPDAVAAWAQASCPGGRRLPSSTHLVWGCGFGATGNSNSMDRSAGVDVQGRQTYYCTPRETSCRRTSN